MEVLDGHLPDTQAGFRPARGCRDSVCALRWFTYMVLRDGRNAVITFIDYSLAFDTESQIFLDGAFADAGVSAKVRRNIQAVFAAATGIVRVRLPSGVNVISEPFNIERGMLQGDIFSDGEDAADMHHRMTIAGESSRNIDYLWRDNRLPRSFAPLSSEHLLDLNARQRGVDANAKSAGNAERLQLSATAPHHR